MKIYDRNLTGTSAPESGRALELLKTGGATAAKSGRTSSGTGNIGSNDSVEFSGALGSLARLLSVSDTSRSTRVQKLTVQYQSGRYRPDSMATSKDIISESLASSFG